MKNLRTDSTRILCIAIGNSGRGDDGIGWKFADELKRFGYNFLDYEYRYQLQIEDAVLISSYDTVIFVDASHAVLENGFEMKNCTVANHYFFSSHMQSAETILYLASDLYNKYPDAYTLAISGLYWDLKTSLSKEAKKNIQLALSFFIKDFLPTIQPKRLANKNRLTA